jgi:20S proteasome alpha/beta subunit
VRRVLELARLDKVFQIHTDLAAATAGTIPGGAGSSGN